MRNGKSLSFGAKRSLYENLYLDFNYRKTEIDIDFKSQREYQLYVLKSFFESNEDMFRMISYLKHDIEELTKWVKFEKMSTTNVSIIAGHSIEEFESLIESYNELIEFIESQILLA